MATEKRLIDADAEIATIKENVCKNCDSRNGVRCRACWVDSMIGFIDEAPTVDAVEVVYCQDCARCKKGFCTIRKDSWGATLKVGLHDFCSDGERKDH